MQTAIKLWWWVVKFMIELGGAVKPVAAKVWRLAVRVWHFLGRDSVFLGFLLSWLTLHLMAGVAINFIDTEIVVKGGDTDWIDVLLTTAIIVLMQAGFWTKWRHQVNIPLQSRGFDSQK